MKTQIKRLRAYVNERSAHNLKRFLRTIHSDRDEIRERMGIILDILLCANEIYKPCEVMMDESESLYLDVAVDCSVDGEILRSSVIYIPEMMEFISYDEITDYIHRVFQSEKYYSAKISGGELVTPDLSSNLERILQLVGRCKNITHNLASDFVLKDIVKKMRDAREELLSSLNE